MSEALVRQHIYTTLAAVTGIGKVYDYGRWAADWQTFINLFKTTVSAKDQIRGFEISRKAAPAVYDSNGEETTVHRYLIRGYMSVSDADASEKTFTALIEAVRAAFRFDFTLGGLCEDSGPLSLDVQDERMFGGVLCHYCELSLPAREVFT